MDSVEPPLKGKKRVVFLAIQALTKKVICMTGQTFLIAI